MGEGVGAYLLTFFIGCLQTMNKKKVKNCDEGKAFPLRLLLIDFNITSNKPTRTPEQQKMDRIQENYINDKEALANEGRSLPTGQQMLAKSKNSSGSGSGKGSSGAGSSNKIIEEGAELLSDSVLSEYKQNNF